MNCEYFWIKNRIAICYWAPSFCDFIWNITTGSSFLLHWNVRGFGFGNKQTDLFSISLLVFVEGRLEGKTTDLILVWSVQIYTDHCAGGVDGTFRKNEHTYISFFVPCLDSARRSDQKESGSVVFSVSGFWNRLTSTTAYHWYEDYTNSSLLLSFLFVVMLELYSEIPGPPDPVTNFTVEIHSYGGCYLYLWSW